MDSVDLESITQVDLQKQSKVLRGPIQIAHDITNRCNSRCLHCFNFSGEDRLKRDELSDEEVLNIVAKQIAEIKPMGSCICGGEPFLRENILYDYIGILTGAGVKVNMVTNGYLLDQKRAEKLKEAGIGTVQVSLDGATGESYHKLRPVKDGFQKATSALKTLVDIGIQTSIAFCPTRFNIKEFPKLVELAKELSCPEVRVQPLMPLGEAIIQARSIIPFEAQYRELVERIRSYQMNNCDLKIEWADPIDHLIRFSQVLPEPNLFAEIKADGYLGVSAYLPLYVGDLKRHSFNEYWEAGYNRIWTLLIVKVLAEQTRSIFDMPNIKPLPYYEENIYIDLVDNTPEEIEETTNRILSALRQVPVAHRERAITKRETE